MLTRVKELHGAGIRARDGQIGRVDDVLFDDEHWSVRYLVINSGGWLQSRKVLLVSSALDALDWDKHELDVKVTRAQVEASPSIATDEPVSRQWEKDYHDYYSWPYYWGGMGLSGTAIFPGPTYGTSYELPLLSNETESERSLKRPSAVHQDDVHLRSVNEVIGYKIVAGDGSLGHVDDFIVDDETWRICYVAVDTKDWWPAKKVLLPPERIVSVSWPDSTVTVDLTRDQLRDCPEWDLQQPMSRAFADELTSYYAKIGLNTSDSMAVSAV